MQDISHRGFIVEDLLCGAPSCSEACLFFSNNLLCFGLPSVWSNLQHAFAWMPDEADLLAVLTLLQVAYLGK